MEWRWGWLWSILWNILVHAVTFNWTELGRDGDRFREWWRSLWLEIENRINGLRSWAQGKISWLTGYVAGLVYQAALQAARTVADLRANLTAWINSIIAWMHGRISWMQGYAFGLYVQAISLINSIRSAIEAGIRAYIDGKVTWLLDKFGWVLPFKHLLPVWRDIILFVIHTLMQIAWQQVRDFLHNPIGFVLGPMFPRLMTVINFWSQYGSGLMTFVANELADLRTTWENGKIILRALVDDPERFIFDLLAPIFLDWLEQLIADNW